MQWDVSASLIYLLAQPRISGKKGEKEENFEQQK